MSLNPEQLLMERRTMIEKKLTDNEEIIYEKLVRQKIKDRPQIEDYADIYGAEAIASDRQEVDSCKKNHLKDSTQRSELLEACLRERIVLSNLLGEGCETIQTNDFDDMNGTDFVVEWLDDKGEPIRLAIDTTVSERQDIINEKFRNIKDKLRNDKGVTIKYFQSELENYKGQITDVPRVIIQMKKEAVTVLCELINKAISIKYNEKIKAEANEELENGDLKISLIKEIISQLQEQKSYLKTIHLNKNAIYDNISILIKQLNKIKKSPTKYYLSDRTLIVAPSVAPLALKLSAL